MNNRGKRMLKAALMALGILSIAPVHAALVQYEKVGFIEGSSYISEAFTIGDEGWYRATLTDFTFPSAFASLSLDLTTGADTIKTLSAEGGQSIYDFHADVGTYYANLTGDMAGNSLGLFGIQVKSLTSTGTGVAPVPIPGAVILLISGLCVLGQMAWRRREETDHDAFVTKGSYSSVTV